MKIKVSIYKEFDSDDIFEDPDQEDAFIGASEEGRKSFLLLIMKEKMKTEDMSVNYVHG